jgi:hypothetical protein
MSEKTKFWLLLIILLASIALLIILNSNANSVLIK